jgi:hypothetical protein
MAEKPLGVRSIRCKDESIDKCPNEPLKYVGTCWNQLEPSGFPKIQHFFKGFWGSSRVNRASLCPRAEDVSTLPWRRWSWWSPVHRGTSGPFPLSTAIANYWAPDLGHAPHAPLDAPLAPRRLVPACNRRKTRCHKVREVSKETVGPRGI